METGDPQGWASIPRWLLYSDKLTPHAKLIYVVVNSHANASGEAWPSHKRLAAESGLSVSSTQRALRELVALSLVTVEERRRRDGGRAASRYRIAAFLPDPGDNPVDGL